MVAGGAARALIAVNPRRVRIYRTDTKTARRKLVKVGDPASCVTKLCHVARRLALLAFERGLDGVRVLDRQTVGLLRCHVGLKPCLRDGRELLATMCNVFRDASCYESLTLKRHAGVTF